jgi:hypothetical protein
MSIICLALPAVATDSWTYEATPTVTVHHHVFNKVRLEGDGCELKIQLWFDAPEEAYADKRNAVRNYYGFRGLVRLADGRKFETKLFINRGAGRRVVTTDLDTSNDGCWSKTRAKIVKLDVHACRGERCRVEPFQ